MPSILLWQKKCRKDVTKAYALVRLVSLKSQASELLEVGPKHMYLVKALQVTLISQGWKQQVDVSFSRGGNRGRTDARVLKEVFPGGQATAR
jgi:hypothetical protein